MGGGEAAAQRRSHMRVGFMFAGQGAQATGMGRDLAAQSTAARAVFEQADAELGRGLSRICFEGPDSLLTESANCQPAIYAASLACLAALRERVPLEPAVCGGLSLGEFAALQAAGAVSFEQGLQLVATRGRLMGEACRAADGAMAAVLNADPALLEDACQSHGVDIANLNCPGQTVISGERSHIEATVQALHDAGVQRIIMLQVDGAFHSRLMQPAANGFAPVLENAVVRRPACPVVQNFSGAPVAEPDEIRKNLHAQVTGSVRWEQCVRTMLGMGLELLIEFGPGRVLSGFMKRIERPFPVLNISNCGDLEVAVDALTAWPD